MEHNKRKILQSYQLLDRANGNNHVAEEPAEYSSADASTDASAKFASKNKPGTSSVAPTDPAAATDYAKNGQTLRLAMALVEGTATAVTDRQANVDQLRTLTQRAAGRAGPIKIEDDDAVVKRLHQLVRTSDRNLAEQLSLYLDIDERELWRKVGCRDCVHWMDRELGIHRTAAYERLRAARALRSLPVIESLFALGRLGWSKVRELTRIATPANEQELAAAALELGASETLQMCQRWRHVEPGLAGQDDSEPGAPFDRPTDACETADAQRAFEQRSVSWRTLRGTATTRITLDLPVESAAEFLTALQAQEDELLAQICEQPESPESPESPKLTPTPRQRRADAMLLMSTKALAHSGHAVATADRYRVMVTIDSRLLGADTLAQRKASEEMPSERPVVNGFGPVAVATAQRLASQARLTVVATDSDGEVVATGRDTRLFSPSTVRAVVARDRCCQMPGCTQSRSSWLHAHHVVPWAEGGESSVKNAALLCSGCHVRLHEGGLRLEQVDKQSVALSQDELMTLSVDEQAVARARIAGVQRFRLLNTDGSWLAGPRRQDADSQEVFPSENTHMENTHIGSDHVLQVKGSTLE